MILTPTDEGLLVVRQPEHGIQTGLFAARWGNEDVSPVEHREKSVQLASTHHDDGWSTWELHPTLDPATDLPVQFHSLTPKEHVPLYRAGIERAATIDPFAGILVSMHGAGLYNDRYGTFRLVEQSFNAEEQSLVDEFLTDMHELQSLLSGVVGLHSHGHVSMHPEVRTDYLRLQVWDRLSLQFAYRLAANGVISPMPVGNGHMGELLCRNIGAFHISLDPYPFDDPDLVFPLRAVVVPDRSYKSSEDFLAEISSAKERTIECRTTPK